MDEANARSHIEAHAEAVVRGDMDAVVADFSPELRSQVPGVAPALLPLPVKAAELLNIEAGDGESVAWIRFSGDGREATLRTEWREIDGRPLIVALALEG